MISSGSPSLASTALASGITQARVNRAGPGLGSSRLRGVPSNERMKLRRRVRF